MKYLKDFMLLTLIACSLVVACTKSFPIQHPINIDPCEIMLMEPVFPLDGHCLVTTHVVQNSIDDLEIYIGDKICFDENLDGQDYWDIGINESFVDSLANGHTTQLFVNGAQDYKVFAMAPNLDDSPVELFNTLVMHNVGSYFWLEFLDLNNDKQYIIKAVPEDLMWAYTACDTFLINQNTIQ